MGRPDAAWRTHKTGSIWRATIDGIVYPDRPPDGKDCKGHIEEFKDGGRRVVEFRRDEPSAPAAPKPPPTAPTSPAKASIDLYVMTNSRIPGEYKVGRSKQVHTRAKDLDRSQNFEIIILVTYHGLGDQENLIHKSLAQYQVKNCPGAEWF